MARMLDQAAAWAGGPWRAWTYTLASRYREHLRQSGLAPASINLALCAIRGVLREAARLHPEARAELLEAAGIRGVKGSRLPAGRALASTEIAALWSSGHARDVATLAILYGAGLRCEEAVSLDLADYDREARTLRVLGKGDKERLIPIPRFARHLDSWLAVRGSEPGPLLCHVTRSGRVDLCRLSERGLAKAVDRLTRRAGVAHASPHDFRRTCITALLDAGADLGTAQEFAGHSDPATTRRYDRRGQRALERAATLLWSPE
jgi:site-specific recombinase XerD